MIKDLLGSGYFPKELPPPFNTISLSEKIEEINDQWSGLVELGFGSKSPYPESKWGVFSIPKVAVKRRLLNIPNPLHHSILCATISENWNEIDGFFAKSIISTSKPTRDINGRRFLKPEASFTEFKRKRLKESFDFLYEVKTDISRFYGTIYTHSVPWLIHSKSVAKNRRNDMSLLGNLIDKNLRSCNSGQTVGIPVGPDTSFVLGEVITCHLDQLIQEEFKAIKTFRYIDDYYFYCNSNTEAETVLKFIQSLLTDYQLEINEEKTIISRYPFIFDNRWSIELGSYRFRRTPRGQLTDIERFVSLSFTHSNENEKDSVLLFSIQILKALPLFDENWDIYESLILKIGIAEPRCLPDVIKILSSNSDRVSNRKIQSVSQKLLKVHLPKGHHFEVSWALWMCVEFGIRVNKEISEQIFASNDWISILIALDLQERGLISECVCTSGLLVELTAESLLEENWLFTYEVIKKGWLKPVNNPIKMNRFFSILHDNDVTFYNESLRVEKFEMIAAEVESITSNANFKTGSVSLGGSGGGAGY